MAVMTTLLLEEQEGSISQHFLNSTYRLNLLSAHLMFLLPLLGGFIPDVALYNAAFEGNTCPTDRL